MKVTNELIERFFNNQCTGDEAKAVADFLQEHPAAADRFYDEREWDNLSSGLLFSENQERQVRQRIRQQLQLDRRKINYYPWLAAAAVFFLLVTAGFLLTKDKTPQVNEEVVHNLIKINYDKEDMPLQAEDGSVIFLKPGSEIQYAEHFNGKERRFLLKGEARFKVVKDVKRPFRVHAGGTVTTALGTEFTITTDEKQQQTKIILHEGRVVVHPEGKAQVDNKEPIYLVAGEDLLVNSATFKKIVRPEKPIFKPSLSERRETHMTSSKVTFNNQRLKTIFNTLNSEFAANIHFKDNDIAGRSFTGAFKRDSLMVDRIVKEISLLNKLTVEIRDDAYFLHPKQQHPQ